MARMPALYCDALVLRNCGWALRIGSRLIARGSPVKAAQCNGLKPSASTSLIELVSERLALVDPQRDDARLDAKGSPLSGGQKQLPILGRALYK